MLGCLLVGGNVTDIDDDVGSLAKQLVKVPEEKQSDETRRMRNRFLSWFPRAKISAFVFGSKGVSWGGKTIFPNSNRTNPGLSKDLGLVEGFPSQ